MCAKVFNVQVCKSVCKSVRKCKKCAKFSTYLSCRESRILFNASIEYKYVKLDLQYMESFGIIVVFAMVLSGTRKWAKNCSGGEIFILCPP